MLLLLSHRVFADEHYFQNYSVEDGLPQSKVTFALQDRQGYLWIATDGGGVSRFDGFEFETFSTAEGLADSSVLCILEDGDGNLWFGTNRGLSRYDGRGFVSVGAGSSFGPVYALIEDDDRHLWVGAERGVFELPKGSASFEARFADLEAVANGVHSLLEDGSGRLWLGTGDGVVRFDEGDVTYFGAEQGLPGDLVNVIIEDHRGDIWFGTSGGAARYDGNRFEALTMEQGLRHNDVRALLETHDGVLWIATDGGGVCRFDGEEVKCLTESNGLSSNFVWSLTEDREGNLWISTYRGGIDRYSGDRFVRFSPPGGFGGDVVRSILEDRKGNLWFGTLRNGAARWDGETLTQFTTRDGLMSDFVLTVFEDRDFDLWFGTFQGISRFDGRSFRSFGVAEGLPDRVVRAIQQDEEGHIWIGTNVGGVSIYDGENFRNFSIADGLTDDRITALARGKAGVMWIGSQDGLTKYTDGRFVDFGAELGIRPRNISHLIDDGADRLWIGEYGRGIHRCPVEIEDEEGAPTRCLSFTSEDGLIHDSVVSMAFDGAGYLWVGTENGVSRFDLHLYERTGKKVFKNYETTEGFTGIECINKAIYRDQRGDLWFGTVAGAFRYRPAEDRFNTVEPLTGITNVRLFFEDVNWGAAGVLREEGRLEHDENHLTFDFLGISLTAPSKVRYRYRLDGWDDAWSPTTAERQATYQKLPPGHYAFHVEARNGDGVWNDRPATFAFAIVPPFWRTGWFAALSVMSLVMAVLGFVKVRLWQLEEQRRVLQVCIEESTRALRKEKEKVESINAELEDRVAQRTEELVGANETLRKEMEQRERLEDALLNARKLESLGLLAGGIAHDFNNLLTAVLGNISLARQITSSGDRASGLLGEAEKASYRARDLTQQLLTFSKGGQPIKKLVPVEELVREAAGFALRGSNVKSHFQILNSLWAVDADQGQISQVIHNLVLNAAQAMPEGGIVEIGCRNIVVGSEEIQLRAGKYMVISVEDRGAGIKKEDLQRVFDPYFTTKTGGVGLGLATAYSIVKKHDGLIKVDTHLGSGTAFHVYLPASDLVTDGSDSRASGGDSEGPRATQRSKILVMDDEEAVRRVAQEALKRFGYHVELAADGETAVELYRRAAEAGDPFALVIMDLTVPAGMGGKKAIGELRQLNPKVRAVVSSGYSNDPVMSEFAEHGFCDVLPKPFSAEALQALVVRALKI